MAVRLVVVTFMVTADTDAAADIIANAIIREMHSQPVDMEDDIEEWQNNGGTGAPKGAFEIKLSQVRSER